MDRARHNAFGFRTTQPTQCLDQLFHLAFRDLGDDLVIALIADLAKGVLDNFVQLLSRGPANLVTERQLFHFAGQGLRIDKDEDRLCLDAQRQQVANQTVDVRVFAVKAQIFE